MMVQNKTQKNPDVSETLFSLCSSKSSLMIFQYELLLICKQPHSVIRWWSYCTLTFLSKRCLKTGAAFKLAIPLKTSTIK